MTLPDENSGVTKSISLKEKVAFLKQKENYPHPTSIVEVIQTHMSWVFLTDQFVYKLKIPSRFDHLSLKTSKARLQNCIEELRLNKRLAGEVYSGIVPLSVDKDGNLMMGRGKWPVDWLVKMKRLPANMMLDKWMVTGKASREDLKPSAKLLTRFYMNADAVPMSMEEYQQRLTSDLSAYCDELCSAEYGFPKQQIISIHERLSAFIEANTAVFKRRLSNGKIIEGHGDLKPDHICLSPPAVIDCLEFDKRLRILDVFDDLAFLSLECDRLGASWVGSYFIQYYTQKAKDTPPDGLLDFYKSYKSVIRALLSIRHIKEKQYRGDPKWKKRAREYLELAEFYIH